MRICADAYTFRVGAAFAPGIHLGVPLAHYRDHGNNHFIRESFFNSTQVQAYCTTAADMRRRFPELVLFTDNLITKAVMSVQLREKKVSVASNEYIQHYFAGCSRARKAAILAVGSLRTWWYRAKRMLLRRP